MKFIFNFKLHNTNRGVRTTFMIEKYIDYSNFYNHSSKLIKFHNDKVLFWSCMDFQIKN